MSDEPLLPWEEAELAERKRVFEEEEGEQLYDRYKEERECK
jgi:hypothetical protein